MKYIEQMKDQSYFYLAGLSMILFNKLSNKSLYNSCDYFFNDYIEEKDIIVYTGPCLSDNEMKNKYNEIKNLISTDTVIDYTKFNKLSLRKVLLKRIDTTTISSTINYITLIEDKLIDSLYNNDKLVNMK